jgi:prepilin-type N-terminal cleavage/methylation domain-containing protein
MRQLHNNQGFTLIEILIALVLVTLVMGIVISDPFSSRDQLDKDVNSIERSIRFMGDEAALKNAVVRLHFLLDKKPQEYAVEYGPSDSFILPSKADFETTVESKEEEENRKKEQKNLNLKFNKVVEFQDKNFEVSNNVSILGVATGNSAKLITKGEASIYSFPTGEKDEALVIIASDEAIITLRVNPFNVKVDRQSWPVKLRADKDLQASLEDQAKELFDKWQKEK